MLALHQRAGPESALREPGVGGGEHEARPAGAGVRVHLPAAAIRTAYASAEGRDKPAASIRTTYASGQGRDLPAAIRMVHSQGSGIRVGVYHPAAAVQTWFASGQGRNLR